jgi:periplasmic protein TonB
MKRLLIPFALIFCISAIAQPYQSENLIYLNSDGNPTKEKKAVMVRQVLQLNDTLWETNLYRKNGPRIMSLRSREATGTVFNGSYQTYRADGWEDTLGYYHNGKREGRWTVFAKTRSTFQLQYEDGQLLWKKDSMQVNRELDSAMAAHTADTFKKIEIESEYPGGVRGWLSFLNHNLRYPDDAVNNNLMGIVVIEFIVDKDGSVLPTSLAVRQSVAISLDEESLRVIYKSGSWVPAVQSGRNVKSYKLQPIVFRLERR